MHDCAMSAKYKTCFPSSCTQDKSDDRIQETLLVGYECKGLYNMYVTKSYIKLCNDKCEVCLLLEYRNGPTPFCSKLWVGLSSIN